MQIVLRDPAPAPSEGTDQTTDPQPEPVQDQNQSKPALEGQSNQQVQLKKRSRTFPDQLKQTEDKFIHDD